MLASASALIAIVSFVTVFVVTSIVIYNNSIYKTSVDQKLNTVVKQVNSANQYAYEFDKKQQKQIVEVEQKFANIEKNYITKTNLNDSTKGLDITNGNIEGKLSVSTMGSGSGIIGFNSEIGGASQNQNYTIGRGTTPTTLNHLVIKTPNEKTAGINLISDDNKSRLFVDTSSGQVNIDGKLKTNSLQLGNKWSVSGVGDSKGNDGWLRFFDKDGIDFYGGLAAANLWSRDGATLNGNTIMTNATVLGEFTIPGGNSEYNPLKKPTKFASGSNKINYITGDTEILGNTKNIGDMTIGRSLTATGPVKIGHTLSNVFVNDIPLSVNTLSGKKGASFGMGDLWSHFPWSDGNTYIRPGMNNKNINVGDVGTSEINLGTGLTNTNVKGTLTVRNSAANGPNWLTIDRQPEDTLQIGSDGLNKGIISKGGRDFNIYTNDVNRFSINNTGKITNRGTVVAPSIGRELNDNAPFEINSLNAGNNTHPGTIIYQGALLNKGGLGVGTSTKVPDGQVNIKNSLCINNTCITEADLIKMKSKIV